MDAKRLELTDASRPLYNHLRTIGATPKEASQIARAMEISFGAEARQALDQFLGRGLSFPDLSRLVTNHANLSAGSLENLFTAERILIELGIKWQLARYTTISKRYFFEHDPQKLENSIALLRTLGFTPKQIEDIAFDQPSVLYLDPPVVETWARTKLESNGKSVVAKLTSIIRRSEKKTLSKKIARPKSTVCLMPAYGSNPEPQRQRLIVQQCCSHLELPKERVLSVMTKGDDQEPASYVREASHPGPTVHAIALGNDAIERPAPIILPKDLSFDRSALVSKIKAAYLYQPRGDVDERMRSGNKGKIRNEIALLKKERLIKEAKRPSAWSTFEKEHQWLFDDGRNVLDILDGVRAKMLERHTVFFVWQLLHDPELLAIFKINADVIEERWARLVRWTGAHVHRHPELLLLPIEGIALPELRFRTNEIVRYGKKPALKPYIHLLFEPERTVFQKKLEAAVHASRYSW